MSRTRLFRGLSVICVGGGTYTEICHFPNWRQLFGSGGRAAAVLAGLSDSVTLCTFGRKAAQDSRVALADCFGFRLGTIEDAPEVTFEYLHAMRPSFVWPTQEISGRTISLSGSVVLRFGCWEGDIRVEGGRVVYDPQSPGNPQAFSANGSGAERLAIVCNVEEGRRLTGATTPESIAKGLLGNHGAHVVVLKAGTAGAIVCSDHGPLEAVPAFRTERVFPIGSGDVFSAVFAHYWGELEYMPVQAAELASKAAAWYCATMTFPTGDAWETRSPIPWCAAPQIASRRPKVYLAGPFFAVQQLWFVEELITELEELGLDVFSPFHDVGCPTSARKIADLDLAGLRASDVVLAVLDGLDPGTIFEVGYARSIDIPVIGLQQQRGPDDMKMFEGTDVILETDLATALYKTCWIGNERAV